MKFFNLLIFSSLLLSNVGNSLTLNMNTPKHRSKLDKRIDARIYKLTKPAVLNYVIVPVVGLVDSMWVSRLGNSNMLAGQGCGDQVFSMVYYIFSFLPAVLAPEISKLYTQDKKEDIKELVNISIIISMLVGTFLSLSIFNSSDKVVNIFIGDKANIRSYAIEYLKFRTMSFSFVFTNSVVFSILRGMTDFNNAIIINLQSQIINIIIDPILMKKYGLKGVAIGSNIADIYCTARYLILFKNKKLYSKTIPNIFVKGRELLSKGIFVQIKNICNNLVYLFINNKVIQLDKDGYQTAAHILSAKLFDLGRVLFDGLSSVSSIIIPSEKIFDNDLIAKKRLLHWSHIFGLSQFFLYLILSLNVSLLTNDLNVIAQVKKLLIIISVLQYFSGLTSTNEGILQGYQKYKTQSLLAVMSLIIMVTLTSLSKSVEQIWMTGIIISIIKLLCFRFI